MATSASVSDFYKTSDTPGTPVVLGAATVKFSSITLYGQSAAGVTNSGTVKYRPVDGTGWVEIEPGTSDTIEVPAGSFLKASQIEIDVEQSGDGVYAIYTTAVVYEGE